MSNPGRARKNTRLLVDGRQDISNAVNALPAFAIAPRAAPTYVVTPDEADAEAARIETLPGVRIDRYPQFGGRTVYAITLPCRDGRGLRLMVGRPHAHEPAGTAACFEVVRQLTDPDPVNRDWCEAIRDRFTVTFVPDGNPSGSQRAPVQFWDGTEIPNEEFFLWMFGESGDSPSDRFPRVAQWDTRQVVPPARIGIAYERLDQFIYVEPNRDHRSTYFQSFFQLDEQYRYQAWLDLHQTEYVGMANNCHVAAPTDVTGHSARLKDLYAGLGHAIIRRWRAEGGTPMPQPRTPYLDQGDQFRLLSNAWSDIDRRLLHVLTEVQNNSVRTPVDMQVSLSVAAIDATLRWMVEHRHELAAALGGGSS